CEQIIAKKESTPSWTSSSTKSNRQSATPAANLQNKKSNLVPKRWIVPANSPTTLYIKWANWDYLACPSPKNMVEQVQTSSPIVLPLKKSRVVIPLSASPWKPILPWVPLPFTFMAAKNRKNNTCPR